MDGELRGEVRRIRSQLHRIEQDRVSIDQERRRLLAEQSARRADQGTPGALLVGPRPIRRRLRILNRDRDRLNHEEASLRAQERTLSVRLGSTPSSSSRSTGSAPRVRQSALYSARRGPRGRQGRPVGEHTAEVSTSEPGNTIMDLSQFEALTLNTTPPTLESADRVVEHPPEVRSSDREGTRVNLSEVEGLSLNVTAPASETTDQFVEHPTEVRSSERGGTSVNLSKVEGLSLNVPAAESTAGAAVHAGDMDSRAPDSTNAKQPAVREGLSPRSQEMWLGIDKYLAEHTFDDMWEGMVAMKNGFCNPPKKVPFPNKKSSKKLVLPDSPQPPHGLDAQSIQATTQCEESTDQIIENGRRWMKKEVMEAYKKYIKETGDNGVEFELDELLHQCLSVETYAKIFHHYNFTVKTKHPGSNKWTSTLYFAQVKEMYGRKHYFCYPLDPFEVGVCHACKNQGMVALKHPAVPIGYETGQAATGCPFFEDSAGTGCPFYSDSDDDDGDRVPDDEGMAWAFSQAFLGGAQY